MSKDMVYRERVGNDTTTKERFNRDVLKAHPRVAVAARMLEHAQDTAQNLSLKGYCEKVGITFRTMMPFLAGQLVPSRKSLITKLIQIIQGQPNLTVSYDARIAFNEGMKTQPKGNVRLQQWLIRELRRVDLGKFDGLEIVNGKGNDKFEKARIWLSKEAGIHHTCLLKLLYGHKYLVFPHHIIRLRELFAGGESDNLVFLGQILVTEITYYYHLPATPLHLML